MIDWKALAPHRPLDEGDLRYEPRPDGGSTRLVQMLVAGGTSIALTGPVGSGKSTELARAAAILGDKFEVHLIHLDRQFDMRQLSVNAVLDHIDQRLNPARKRGAIVREYRDSIIDALRSRQDKDVILLIDGLEKSPAELARDVTLALLQLSEEARLVVVVSPSLVTGPAAYDIIHTNSARLLTIRALPYWQPEPFMIDVAKVRGTWMALDGDASFGSPRPDHDFLRGIFVRRLWPEPLQPHELDILNRAAIWSGGLPRVFLQLMQGAGTYASLAGRDWPSQDNLRAAVADQTDSLSLLLQDGDAQALAKAFGTNGLEVPLERKLRFLTHGLLLEYERDGEKICFPAPLLKKLLSPYLALEPTPREFIP